MSTTLLEYPLFLMSPDNSTSLIFTNVPVFRLPCYKKISRKSMHCCSLFGLISIKFTKTEHKRQNTSNFMWKYLLYNQLRHIQTVQIIVLILTIFLHSRPFLIRTKLWKSRISLAPTNVFLRFVHFFTYFLCIVKSECTLMHRAYVLPVFTLLFFCCV